jgi:PST family polysaccharide transporter
VPIKNQLNLPDERKSAAHQLGANLAYLFGVHLFSYLLPLFTLPYLARTLGPTEWGELAFAEAFGRYVVLVIAYGFQLSATREIARLRDNPLATGKAVANVVSAQAILTSVVLITTFVAAPFIPILSTNRKLLITALLSGIAQSFTPLWYFQGRERLKVMAPVTVLANAIGAATVFILVRGSGDGWIRLALQGCFSSFAATSGFVLLWRETPFVRLSFGGGIRTLRSGASMFLFVSAASLYTTANVLLLGMLAPANAVSAFAGAEKIAKASISCLNPIAQTFFPRINYLIASDQIGAKREIKRSIFLTLGFGCALGLGLLIGAPICVRMLLGPGFDRCVPILRILSLLPPIIAASNVLGLQWMLPLRMDREFNTIILAGGAANIALALVLAPKFKEIGMASAVVIVELMVTSAIMFQLHTRGLVPWRVGSVESRRET